MIRNGRVQALHFRALAPGAIAIFRIRVGVATDHRQADKDPLLAQDGDRLDQIIDPFQRLNPTHKQQQLLARLDADKFLGFILGDWIKMADIHTWRHNHHFAGIGPVKPLELGQFCRGGRHDTIGYTQYLLLALNPILPLHLARITRHPLFHQPERMEHVHDRDAPGRFEIFGRNPRHPVMTVD
jgi:hypothetical protein